MKSNKTNTKMTELLGLIDSNYQLMTTDLTQHPYNTRLGMETAQRQAAASHDKLLQEYAKEFSRSVAKIFVKNNVDVSAKISEMLNKEGAFTLAADSIYKKVAERIEPMLGLNREFNSASYVRLLEAVGEFSRQYKIVPEALMKEPTNIVVPTLDDLVKVVRNTVRGAFGDALNKAYLTDAIVSKAINEKIDNNLTVVVFSGLTDDERSALMDSLFSGQPAFGVELAENEEPDRSLVMKLYRKISDSVILKNK